MADNSHSGTPDRRAGGNSLPEGWCVTTLGTVLELKYGKSLPAKSRDGGKFPVYGSNGVVGGHSEPLIDGRGLIVGRKGSYGEVQISEQPFFPIDTTYFVDELWGQPLKYWYYQLRQLPLTELNRSTAIPGLNREDAYAQEIPLPPLAEQKVIAEKLDTLLAQVDTIKARLERIPDIIKRFRQSVLAAAVSGKLTEEWRGINGFEEPGVQKLGSITGEISQGWSPKCLNEEVTDESWGVIKTSSVQEVVFNQHENKKLPDTLTQKESLKIYPGDILTTRAGPRSRCGVTCYVEDISLNLMICDKVYRYRVKENFGLSKFLVMLLNSPATLEEIETLKTGISESGMNLTQKKFKELNLFWPSVREQTEIVRRVEELFAFADSIEKKAAAALERVNNLTQSILAKAFRGELTADWRTANPELISGDNSAEALLAKIQAEREKLALEKKAAKKPRKKKAKA